jgi:heat shock protein HslJ
LEGKWEVVSMQRQQKADKETLSNVYIEFRNDLSFGGNASCNNMSGVYTLKGTSVKFSNIISTKMACNNLDQENAFLQLLEDRVSAYTVDANKLLLRDGSSNIVFECIRKS